MLMKGILSYLKNPSFLHEQYEIWCNIPPHYSRRLQGKRRCWGAVLEIQVNSSLAGLERQGPGLREYEPDISLPAQPLHRPRPAPRGLRWAGRGGAGASACTHPLHPQRVFGSSSLAKREWQICHVQAQPLGRSPGHRAPSPFPAPSVFPGGRRDSAPQPAKHVE